MKPSEHIWRRLAFKGIFVVIGSILFTAQVSYKFYRRSSMPVFQTVAIQRGSGYQSIPHTAGTASLSLDKRFDLKPAFALFIPIFRIHFFTGRGQLRGLLPESRPVFGNPVLSTPRGPPCRV